MKKAVKQNQVKEAEVQNLMAGLMAKMLSGPPAKNFLTSKIIFASVAFIGLSVYDIGYAGGDWRSMVAAGFGALMIILRSVTNQAVKLK